MLSYCGWSCLLRVLLGCVLVGKFRVTVGWWALLPQQQNKSFAIGRAACISVCVVGVIVFTWPLHWEVRFFVVVVGVKRYLCCTLPPDCLARFGPCEVGDYLSKSGCHLNGTLDRICWRRGWDSPGLLCLTPMFSTFAGSYRWWFLRLNYG